MIKECSDRVHRGLILLNLFDQSADFAHMIPEAKHSQTVLRRPLPTATSAGKP